ncbi:hypothetical protein [Bdellovibrio sp. HCB-110]|uniref:hypothetical protein n=1 Tax=Bdellovibrio sp. HCB-110 TaxID=3391182 RepID=UPI0039B541A9
MRQFFVFVFSLVLLFSGVTASASEQCSSLFLVQNWEVSSRVRKNKFVTNRDLYEYREVLHTDFMNSLSKLTPDQHWVDLGAGKANAQIDYIKSFSNPLSAAQATGVAYKLDRWFSPPKFDGKLQIKEGAFEQQPTATWKKADLVTDVFGVISYTHDLHTSLQKVFDLMNVKGELYIFTTNYHTSIKVGEKKSLSLMDFLATIEGIHVEGRYGTIKITKEIENVIVPSFELVKYVDDAPPSRTYIRSDLVH